MFKFLKPRRQKINQNRPPSYPENSHLIWNKGMAMDCDHRCFASPFTQANYKDIKEGDILWLQSRNTAQFAEEIFPTIKSRFTLVTTYGTRSMPVECGLQDPDALIGDDRLVHWFTQNFKYKGQLKHKVSPIPIGLDFHSQWEQGQTWRFDRQLKPSEQEAIILAARRNAPLSEKRIKRVYADFHFNNTTRKLKKRDSEIRYDRKEIYRLLKKNPAMVFQDKRVPRHVLWDKMAQYRFVISPHGVGLDCHRTWEALVLGCCVIVMCSSLDPLYEGLPVVIVDDYREITPDKLNEWYDTHRYELNRSTINPRLTNKWWMDHIRSIVQV